MVFGRVNAANTENSMPYLGAVRRAKNRLGAVRSPPSGLKDSTVNPAFFIAPAMNPRRVCRCRPILFMISARLAPFFRWSMATTWAVLLASRGELASCVLAARLAWGGVPLADYEPHLALRAAAAVPRALRTRLNPGCAIRSGS